MRHEQQDEFADLMRATHVRLFRVVLLIVGDFQQAEDIMQATWIKAYLRWPRLAEMDDPVAYVRMIAVNEARSWWRRPWRREQVGDLVDRAVGSGSADAAAEHDRVWSAVLKLPPRQRAVVVLRYYEDLSEDETARTLGVAVGTVKAHCHAACQALGRSLSATETEALTTKERS